MFERYTERARRVIFFARYEASQYGSTTIESEHMLLGLLREDKTTIETLLKVPAQGLAREVARSLTVREKISTSIDLPLSAECKRSLAFAAEEAETLAHGRIGTEHLLLGLMRVEESPVAKVLRQYGLDLTRVRQAVSERVAENAATEQSLGFLAMLSAVPVFHVTNVARSIEWYRDVLGFNANAFGNPNDPTFAGLRRDGVEIMLQKTDQEPTEPRNAPKGVRRWDAYIRIRDVRTFRKNIQSKLNIEIPITETTYGCSELTIVDLDGHVLVFGECS